MKIAVLGMHRSGHNAIAKWFLRQEMCEYDLYYREGDWVQCDELESYWFVSQANHPDHSNWKDHTSSYGHEHSHVLTIEREGIGYFDQFCKENDYTDRVIVVRSFRNWLASAYKMSGQMVEQTDVNKYLSHLTARNDDGFVVYDKWFADRDYRHDLALQFGLEFNDCGINDVPPNGGGSSFDGLKYNGHAQDMNVLSRWQEFTEDRMFNHMLKVHEHVEYIYNDVIGV